MVTIHKGSPFPLGATKVEGGWNFSIFSEHPVTLLIAPRTNPADITEIPLTTKTGSLYHVMIESELTTLYYGYKVQDRLLVDPYAKALDSGTEFGNNRWKECNKTLLAYTTCEASDPFDWGSDQPLNLPQSELIIYEMHVRAFTKHGSSKVSNPGTFLGVIEKIPYLKELGITAVELLPIQEFDECDYDRKNPKTNERLYNLWGYSPLSFFAPMSRYGSPRDFKAMVKALHAAGIEVILDLVFNHTGEGNEDGKIISWKGFAEEDYYLVDQTDKHLNFSGCGNTLNCASPITQDMIVECLRHLVIEYHVDGFRFDLASILARGREGRPLAEPPLLERITHDPILKTSKLIAEPWDAAGLHQVGSFFQSAWQGASHWMEWNDDYRSTVRRFIKGDYGLAGRFATKISGSQDVYGRGGSPLNSVNFITCHDGFSLADLVSYNQKHNTMNGEENRDGVNHNDSWNCGSEGPTAQSDVLRLREKQMKNFFVALLLSQGIPMLHMGDEYGHTKLGNNNSWCQDNDVSWFLWNQAEQTPSLLRFYKELVAFRKKQPTIGRQQFLGKDDVEWHGIEPNQPDWSPSSHFIAYTLKGQNELYIAFNASVLPIEVTLPKLRPKKMWTTIVNTNALAPNDFSSPETAVEVESAKLKIAPHSAVVLLAQEKL